MRIKYKRNLSPVRWSVVIVISWIFCVEIVILIRKNTVLIFITRRSIVTSSHIIVANFNHDFDFASVWNFYWFDTKLFLKIDELPFLFWVFVSVSCCENKFFWEFFVDFILEFVGDIFLIIMGQYSKSTKHYIPLAHKRHSIEIVTAHIIVIIML